MNRRSILALALLVAACKNDPAPPTGDAGIDTGIVMGADAGSDAGAALPDLTIDGERARTSARVLWQTFAADDCVIAEGCIDAPGRRRLLLFDTTTPNHGAADLVLGPPSAMPDVFQYSMCHMHYHFQGYADYRLTDTTGATEVATGHKQAFCLEDFEQIDTSPMVPTRAQYTCERQGITSGWADTYYAGLPCQWIDITDVAPGDYMLEIDINGDHVLPEASYDDNTARVPVTVPDETGVDPLAACATVVDGNRDCGLVNSGSFDCTAGMMWRVGCGSACGLGTCTGSNGPDTIMRVCPGDVPCTSHDEIGFDDDSCGMYCSVATFVCPTSGRYTVLSGSYYSNGDDRCMPAGAAM